MGFNPMKFLDPVGHAVTKKPREKLEKELGLKQGMWDPFGHINKLEEELKEALGYDFEKFNFKQMWEQIREDPERLFFGSIDPFSTKVWNEALGRSDDPIISQMGGPTDQRFQDYIDQGGDPRAAKNAATSHQIAQTIASIYAGGALGSVAGAGASGMGATVTPAIQAGITGATRAAVPMLSAEGDELFPVEYIEQNPGLANYDAMRALGLGNTFGYSGYYGAEGGKVMGYAKGGSAQKVKKAQTMVEDLRQLSEVPGALEMLMTVAAEELGVNSGKTKQLRLYNMGGQVKGYQQGGLSQIMDQAQNVQSAGRGDDEMLLHVSPDEYDALTSMWGEPDINPDTGIPEYGFLSKLWKGIKKTVKSIVKSPLFSFIAPIALNVFAPGLGSTIGGWLGATGKTAATVGNTLLRTGLGAVSGGKEGAISGALSGLTSAGVGADIGGKLGLEGGTAKLAGDAILGGIAGEGTGVGFVQGATGQAMQTMAGNPYQKMEAQVTEMGKEIFNPATGEFDVTPGSEGMMSPVNLEDPFGYGPPPGPVEMSPVPQGGELTAFGDPSGGGVMDWMKDNPWLTAGAGMLGAGALGMFDTPDEGQPDFSGNLPPGFNDPLPNLSFDREQMPIDDYYNYGRGAGAGEAMFFGNNAIPRTGGGPPGPGVGPGGGGRGGRGGGRRGGGGRGGGPGPGGGGTLYPQTPGQLDPMQPSIQGQPLPGLGAGFEQEGGQYLGGTYMWPLKAMTLQQQGWTVDWDTKTAYPPGDTIEGSHGGYVDEYDHGGYAEYALGGLVRKYQSGGHVRGPGSGRSDDIPAVLSDGEYVIDSESVALLGDGSTDAGARRLDQMREKLRKHKAKKLAKGGFSDEAKEPELYMQEGGEAKYIPPRENPHKPGSARYKMWERKYGDYWEKKEGKKEEEEKVETDQLTEKEQEELLAKAKRYKNRSERELEKLEQAKGGRVKKAKGGKAVTKSGLLAVKRLATRLETAITSGNKKRAREIASKLKSLDGSSAVEFARGGRVRGNLTDYDIEDIADDLGGFKNSPAFKRKFKARIREESARRG